ncbi:DUF1304 domain-containing protein [Aerococcus urinaeequi]|uniref:DUF1304 domain-containing protein n=1 Tax=Aerococcus urinaeequi TaxID=51665 RepID=UPI003B3B661E
MSVLSTILITLVALEFFYIMYLETFATTSAATQRVFKMSETELKGKSLNTLLKNQGIYNGLIGVGLLYAAYFAIAPTEISRLLLIYIILVAIYDGLTSDKKIILTQGGLAIIALITTFF